MISMMQIWVLFKVPLLTHNTPRKSLDVLSRETKIRQFICFSLVETDFQAKSGYIKHKFLQLLNILTIYG